MLGKTAILLAVRTSVNAVFANTSAVVAACAAVSTFSAGLLHGLRGFVANVFVACPDAYRFNKSLTRSTGIASALPERDVTVVAWNSEL